MARERKIMEVSSPRIGGSVAIAMDLDERNAVCAMARGDYD
jgi:hypothetical protein